jgi:ribosomal protein S18 acetylase RimI-like enzyme
MEIREDRWLSSIFDHSVFKIDVDSSPEAGDRGAPNICALIRDHSTEQRAAFYYAKIDTTQIGMVRELSLAGLYVVDVNVVFGLKPGCGQTPAMSPGVDRYSIREIESGQHDEVLQIAGSCFRYSRFHLDPLISPAIANRIKHDWIQSYINKKRGDRLFVASLGGQPVGFLAALASESSGKRVRTIDLIGVSNGFQRQGVGQALVAFFIDNYRDDCDYFEVGTQVANTPSMRLYRMFGFDITRTQYVMHMTIPDKNQSN